MLQTGNRWPARGKKRQKKKACQRRENVSLPSFLPPSLPPSSLYPQLEGKGRPRSRWRLEARSAGSGCTSKGTSSLGEFLKMALLYWSKLAPYGLWCKTERSRAGLNKLKCCICCFLFRERGDACHDENPKLIEFMFHISIFVESDAKGGVPLATAGD